MSTPLHYDLWANLAVQNRHLRRTNWLHWGVHLLLVAAVVLMATRPLMAVRVDTLGAASVLDPIAPANAPGADEAEHVARLISQYLLEVTSGSIARDLGKAYALMTPEFERAYRAKVQDDKLLPLLEKGSLRTQLTFEDGATEVRAQSDGDARPTRYFVTLAARLAIFPAELNTAPVMIKDLTVRVTLAAVPRTPRTLNGLLVDWFDKQVLEAPASNTVNVSPIGAAP